jgi:hypothetical protein
MACALISDHIRVYMKANETKLSMLLGGAIDLSHVLSRSALQNPELNRYELDCLLRRSERPVENNGWGAFFAMTRSGCANSNGAADIS